MPAPFLLELYSLTETLNEDGQPIISMCQLKEIIDNGAIRVGDYGSDKVYIYFESEEVITEYLWRMKVGNTVTNEYSFKNNFPQNWVDFGELLKEFFKYRILSNAVLALYLRRMAASVLLEPLCKDM